MKKLLIFTISAILISPNLFSQGMPLDSKTGRVTYTESVEVPGVPKNELVERAAFFVSGFSNFRGTINAIYVDKEKSIVRCLMSINITETLKTSLNQVNASVQIEFFDGKFTYSISNLYVFTTTVSIMYLNDNKDTFIEKSQIFDIRDFEKKNNNSKNTHKQVIFFIDSLKSYINNPNSTNL